MKYFPNLGHAGPRSPADWPTAQIVGNSGFPQISPGSTRASFRHAWSRKLRVASPSPQAHASRCPRVQMWGAAALCPGSRRACAATHVFASARALCADCAARCADPPWSSPGPKAGAPFWAPTNAPTHDPRQPECPPGSPPAARDLATSVGRTAVAALCFACGDICDLISSIWVHSYTEYTAATTLLAHH